VNHNLTHAIEMTGSTASGLPVIVVKYRSTHSSIGTVGAKIKLLQQFIACYLQPLRLILFIYFKLKTTAWVFIFNNGNFRYQCYSTGISIH